MHKPIELDVKKNGKVDQVANYVLKVTAMRAELMKMVDPSGRGVVIYSSLLDTLLKAPETRNYFKPAEAS